MPHKPTAGLFRRLFQCAGFFEEARRAGDVEQLLFAGQEFVGFPVHFDNRFIVASDDQQGRGGDG